MPVSIIRNIDLNTKLKAACAYDLREVNTILKEFIQWGQLTNHQNYSLNRQDYLTIFDFTKQDLLSYLQNHPEVCDRILGQSYDKRYSPSTFIEESGNKFRVGWYGQDRQHVRHFETITDAAADYILFSWGIDRL